MHTSEALDRKLFVGGKWVSGDGFIEVRSPYSGELVGRVSRGSAELTRSALDAAERAMATPLPDHARAAILDRVADQRE